MLIYVYFLEKKEYYSIEKICQKKSKKNNIKKILFTKICNYLFLYIIKNVNLSNVSIYLLSKGQFNIQTLGFVDSFSFLVNKTTYKKKEKKSTIFSINVCLRVITRLVTEVVPCFLMMSLVCNKQVSHVLKFSCIQIRHS